MEKPEITEALAKAKALNLKEGLIVRSHDGRSFFLTKEEIERKTLSRQTNAAVAKVFEKAGAHGVAVRENYVSCNGMLEWLMANDPFNEHWRAYSAIWIEYC